MCMYEVRCGFQLIITIIKVFDAICSLLGTWFFTHFTKVLSLGCR